MLVAKNIKLLSPWSLTVGIAVSGLLLSSCSPNSNEQANTGSQNNSEGTLNIVANGEDFAQEGMVSKDQWQIDFDHVFVNFEEVQAADLSFIEEPDATASASFAEETTIDLTQPKEGRTVASLQVPATHYRGLQWKLSPAQQGAAKGSSVLLAGQAKKSDQTIQFSISLDSPLSFACGDYVGDDRKGILAPNESAELEATFHLDHLFGNGEAPLEDAINQKSLGFDALASLASNSELKVSMDDLKTQLAASDYETLVKQIKGLGHVGEGHCEGKVA